VRVALEAPLGVPVDAEPRAAAARAGEVLAALGHDVREAAPDWDDESFPTSWATYMTGTGQHLLRVVERLHGRAVDPDLLEPATRAWLVESERVPLVDYLEAGERLWAFARRILGAWRDDEILVTPTLTRLPARVAALHAQAGVTDDAVRFSAFVRPWNVTGQPAVSLPLAETADGVPVGVQLVGPPGDDSLLLGIAAQLERAFGSLPAHLEPAVDPVHVTSIT
jgi:amidase